MVQFTELPADVVDHLLTALPDFKTLAAFIKVSKAYIYDVFLAHKQTILTAVASTVVGPTLPQALGVAICVHPSDPDPGRTYDQSMASVQATMMSLNSPQRKALESSPAIMEELEDFFSQMYASFVPPRHEIDLTGH